MSKVQTDNDKRFFDLKVNLRIESLPEKEKIKVLECFSGNGLLWKKVQEKTKRDIEILKIDVKKDREGVYLKGNNEKFLNIDLNYFDVIDLDSYGIPYNQLKEVFNRNFKGVVHITAIQTMLGKLPTQLLIDIGYSKSMIKKIPSLFNVNGFEKIKLYLALKGVKTIKGYSHDRKNYYWFKT